MAPMTRSTSLVPREEGRPRPAQNFREASWQYLGQSETQSERDVSVEPASSYDDDDNMALMPGEEDDFEKQLPLTSAEDHEDILHPLREAANRVGREVEKFAEVLDGYNPQRATAQDERHDMMLDLIDLFHGIASDTVDNLRKQHESERRKRDGSRRKGRSYEVPDEQDDIDMDGSDSRYSPPSNQQTTIADLERWEQECQTWDLLRRLVNLRFPAPSPDGSSPPPPTQTPIHKFSSENTVWNSFLKTDELALERKTVLQWLKDTADSSGEDIDVLVQDLQQNADRGDIIAHGWLHTKQAIKNQKRLQGWSKAVDPQSAKGLWNSNNTELLVTQLDPDSTTRQRRKLEAQDEYFERAIWLGCYEMLRRGKSRAEIRDWCSERTEVWRAVSMSGFPDEDLGEDNDIADPQSSALWRRMCFNLARNGGGDDFQRAVYGLVSGDISSVEPVCRSWDDYLFVHYNALLRTQYDTYLHKLYAQPSFTSTHPNFGTFDAVQFHGDSKTAGKRLIEALKDKDKISQEITQPMKMLQGVLIADEFSEFIYQQGLALSKFANAKGVSNLIPPNKKQPENEDVMRYIALDDHDSLRVLTHVLLIFMGLGLDLGGIYHETEVENVIVAYVSFLRLAGKEELIPLYCSQLSGKRKYAVLCRNLIDITDDEQRGIQIKLMRELGLEIHEFVKLQSRFLLGDWKDTVVGYPAAEQFKLFEDVSPNMVTAPKVRKDIFGDDPDKVARVDMLLIRSLEWYLLVDGLWSETFTIGTMLYLRFFKHCHLTAARVLASRIHSSRISRSKTRALIGETLDFDGLESWEDEDLTEVLDGSADQKRLLRNHLLAEARSYRELEALTECLDNLDTVTCMAALWQEDSDIGWQKGWRKELGQAYSPTRESIQPLLKDWLLASQKEGAQAEFNQLRDAYLPETVLAYITVLQFAGVNLTRDFLLEVMDMSARIAEDGSDLLELFMRTGRMKELVEVLALSSKALLITTSQKQSSASRSKKTRSKGWSQELWNVRT